MQVRAKVKNIRISPRKVRLVTNVVVGMPAQKSVDALSFMNKKAASVLKKLVESAMANAQHNHRLDARNLYIKEILVNEGPTIFRFMPRAFGRATKIRKRMSHVQVTLDEMVPSVTPDTAPKQEAKEAKTESKEVMPDVKDMKVEGNVTSKKNVVHTKEHKKEIFDETRKGKHRHQEHQDKKTMKKSKAK